MKKRWKYRYRGMVLLALALVLAAGAGKAAAFPVLARGISGSGRNGRDTEEVVLTEDEQKIYNGLKSAAARIASGKKSSAKVAVSGFSSLWNSQKDISEMMDRIIGKLLKDAAADFYWYDAEAGSYSSWTYADSGKVLTMTISMAVRPEYQGFDPYTADTDITAAAKPAMDRAWSIVSRSRNQTDYRKLKAYLTEICRLISPENEDSGETSLSDADPWPLIWVFDGDAQTNPGAEGYAKAFQYLCDLSVFENAACYTAEGVASGGIGADGHLWNLVSLDGNHYLVDAANCDTGMPGAPDRLFLAGGEGSVRYGYTVFLNEEGDSMTYQYNTDQEGLLGSILRLSSYSYLDPATLKLRITAPQAEEVVFGEPVDSGILKGGSAEDSKGRQVAGTFTWAGDVDFYGNAGTNTLEAVFTPDNSQYEPVEEIPVAVTVNKRPVTVEAEAKTKVYGEPDPELTYVFTNVIEGYPLAGSLTRAAGEDAGTYNISQGDLDEKKNPNYSIAFTENELEISPAAYREQVKGNQGIWPGTGEFEQPVFTGVKGETLKGTLTYSYNGRTDLTYEALKTELAKLPVNAKGTLAYTFVPEKNYGSGNGSIGFFIKTLEFSVGNAKASVSNAVTVKSNAAYGDSWTDIVKIGSITAKSGTGSDSDPQHFKLREKGMPGVGKAQSFQVLYSGTIDGVTYADEIVCTGTVDVKRRAVTVSAGSYQVSKTYDKTRTGGTVSGKLSLNNVLKEDADRLSVTAVPEGYTSPNVSGPKEMTVKISLSGAAAGNYELDSDTVEVPCEIKPKTITPEVKISGSYSYTGYAIAPSLSVTDGSDVLASSDYQMVLSKNKEVGTANVSVRPRSGGNYTWSPAVETEFTIQKGDYKGIKTGYAAEKAGGTAVFELSSMLPAGYQLGDIRVADEDKILDGSPWLSDTALSCRLSGDGSKKGKTAVITLPVTDSDSFRAFELTFTVAMDAGKEEPDNRPEDKDQSGADSKPDTSKDGEATWDIPDNRPPAGGEKGENPDKREPSEENGADSKDSGPSVNPWLIGVWCLLGAGLFAGVFGSAYYAKVRKKDEE